MISFFLSVFCSAILIGVALFLTRQRLTRQFKDIQRRQLEVERNVAAIKLGIERSTTDAQLERLHLGQVRMQESIARRYGPLLQSAGRRQVSEFLSAALRQWAARFGLEPDAGSIEGLARTIGRVEMQESGEIAIATPDLLAQIIALVGMRRPSVSVGLAGPSVEPLLSFLPRVIPGLHARMVSKDTPGKMDALIVDDAILQLDAKTMCGLLDQQGLLLAYGVPAEGEGMTLDGFETMAAEWNTRIYRKSATPS